jgi:hypothetical protein
VRNPADNFNKIIAPVKYSVDPGLEFLENPVDFVLTSDQFFDQIREDKILNKDIRFDVVFIDGLHTAEQVDRDIKNALNFIKDDGFIVLHDCNPPSEWHARETYNFDLSPARQYWNGTTWKAFVRAREREDLSCCCIDCDWGIGVISKTINLGAQNTVQNKYYEYNIFSENRVKSLNLIPFNKFKEIINR